MKSSKILVVDLEATCWERGSGIKYTPEVIEFGICSLIPRTGEIVERESIIVKPYGKISQYCTELTGITQEKVEVGMSLTKACEYIVEKYKPNRLIWSSWGDWDERALKTDCYLKNVQYPFSDQHFNIKAFCAIKLAKDDTISKTTGVSKALELLGMHFEGKPHSGLDDAVNTARILYKLLC